MPQFDLRDIKVAKYINNSGVITYTDKAKAGDAMTVNLEMRNAEGRLYAESALAEYMRKAVGGTVSLGVKYLPDAVQQLLFGMESTSRTLTYLVGTTTTTTSVSGLTLGAENEGNYVGLACYAPTMRDGVKKYFCLFLPKVLFGMPSLNLQTCGENITFQTPVTNGECLASDAASKKIYESAICETEDAAKAWVDAVLNAA